MPNFFVHNRWGQSFINPGVYVHRNEQNGVVPPDPNQLIPLIIGPAYAGTPNTVLAFSSPEAATEILRGGDLLTGIQAAFSPGPDINGPDTVLAIRLGAGIDAPTQAKHTFTDTNPGVAAVQSIAITGTATAGTAVASYGATIAPSPVAYNASAPTIQAHLNTIPAIVAAGGVTSTGTLTAGPIIVTFVTSGVRTPITFDISLATGATAATTTTTTTGVNANTPVLAVTSVDFGQFTNGISLAFAPATKPNAGYLLTLQADPTKANPRDLLIQDNIGRQGIRVRYIGSGTAAAMTITATTLSVAVTGASDSLSIDLTKSQNTTLDQIVNTINAFNGGLSYAADVAALDPNAKGTEMDLITAQPIIAPFTVLYTGAGSACTLAVTIGATDTTLTTTATGATTDNLSILYSGLTTINDLAAAIAGVAKTAGVDASGSTTYTGSKYTVVINDKFKLQPVANVVPTLSPISVKTTAGKIPGYFQTTQHLAALNEFINVFLPNYVTSTIPADASGTLVGAYPLATVGATYLTGGTDAVINSTSWTAAITAAEKAQCQIIVPLTDDIDIQNLVKAHCAAMSSPKQRHERVAIVGGPAGETKSEAIARAHDLSISFNGDYVQVVWPGVVRNDPFTQLPISYPAYLFAAQKAGLSASLGAGKSATNKLVDIISLETEINQTDLEDLINGAVTCPIKLDAGPRRGYVIGKDMMTYQQDANFIKSFFMTRIDALISAKRVREALQIFVGEPNTNGLEILVTQALIKELASQLEDGLLVSVQGDSGYKNLKITRTTDTVNISYDARLTTEADFFFVEANYSVPAKF